MEMVTDIRPLHNDDAPSQDVTVETAEELTRRALESIIKSGEEVPALARYGLRNRRMIRVMLVSLLFDVILTIGVGTVAIQAHTATSAVTQRCVAGNAYKTNDKKLWVALLNLEPQAAATPAERAATARVLALVDKTDTQAKCG
jgi:uncharacterized paraquat-inducible protein A